MTWPPVFKVMVNLPVTGPEMDCGVTAAVMVPEIPRVCPLGSASRNRCSVVGVVIEAVGADIECHGIAKDPPRKRVPLRLKRGTAQRGEQENPILIDSGRVQFESSSSAGKAVHDAAAVKVTRYVPATSAGATCGVISTSSD